MRSLVVLLLAAATLAIGAQNPQQAVYETERAFERLVAEKGLREGFVEYMAPTGVMFMPDVVNGRETWLLRPATPAALTWNPVWIDVSGNGMLAYSIGNSRFRPNGKDDPEIAYGHYISIWLRQPDGSYRAVLDTGINHEKPAVEAIDWRSPIDSGKGSNPDRISAADSAVGFYQLAGGKDMLKAYRSHLADDAIVMRNGRLPAFDKRDGIALLKDSPQTHFSKRKSFLEASDLAYVHGPYFATDKKGAVVERGNYVQVWKLRGTKWLIAADLLVPLPPK